MIPQEDAEFSTLIIDKHATPSIWNDWPNPEEPENRFKFTGVEIRFSQDITIIDRSTYSFLEWLGDVGGLYDGLRIFISFILSPISVFALKTELFVSIFRINKLYPGI